MNEMPVARHFLACAEVKVDAGRQVSLERLVQSVRVRQGDVFPCLVPLLSFYAALANGRGEHRFSISMASEVGGEESEIRRSGSVLRDLGQDPLLVHGLSFRLKSVVFQEPGQYEFRLLCDETVIAAEKIEARHNP